MTSVACTTRNRHTTHLIFRGFTFVAPARSNRGGSTMWGEVVVVGALGFPTVRLGFPTEKIAKGCHVFSLRYGMYPKKDCRGEMEMAISPDFTGSAVGGNQSSGDVIQDAQWASPRKMHKSRIFLVPRVLVQIQGLNLQTWASFESATFFRSHAKRNMILLQFYCWKNNEI